MSLVNSKGALRRADVCSTQVFNSSYATFKSLDSRSSRLRRHRTLTIGVLAISVLSKDSNASVSIPQAISPPPPTSSPAVSWFAVAVVFGLTLSTLAGTFIVTVLYLRPTLKAAEKAAVAAGVAAVQMDIAAKEMEKTALLMQRDIPITMEEIQQASEEFELLGKQLNYLTTTLVKPVVQPVEALGAAGAAAGETASGITRRVVNDSGALANTLKATLNAFKKSMGWQNLTKEQRDEAARLVGLSRRQQDARLWIARWRSRYGGPVKGDKSLSSVSSAQRAQTSLVPRINLDGVAEVGRVLRDSLLTLPAGNQVSKDSEDAAAAVFAALEKAEKAAEEAARASGVLEEAINLAERKGVLHVGSSSEEEDPLGLQ